MFANRRAKRIGDFAAGTIVVRERAEPLAAAPPLPVGALAGAFLAAADAARVQAFAARSSQMIPAAREALARNLAQDIATRYDLVLESPESLLRLLAEGRTPKELRGVRWPLP